MMYFRCPKKSILVTRERVEKMMPSSKPFHGRDHSKVFIKGCSGSSNLVTLMEWLSNMRFKQLSRSYSMKMTLLFSPTSPSMLTNLICMTTRKTYTLSLKK